MKNIYAVLSAVGPDRKGMADDIANMIEEFSCNIEDSKMSVLGGEFAVIMLITGNRESVNTLISKEDDLGKRFNLQLNIKETSPPNAVQQGIPYLLETISMDTEGIVHSITKYLREQSINIEDLETEKTAAPLSGSPMFHMRAHIIVPGSVSLADFRDHLAEIEHEKNLDINLKAMTGE